MTVRRVTWRRVDEVQTDEHATLTVRDGGLSLVGTVIGAENGVPLRIEYRVMADGAGFTTAAHVRDLRGFEQRSLALERDAKGAWSVNGAATPALRGCTDLDLGCTPATSTLPIRRLRLGIGGSKVVQSALVRFPELTVERAARTYTRLDESTYRLESGGAVAEIVVDDDGLVAGYAGWRRTGIASGIEDSEPLDARR
jgi:hypothetical protein